MIQSVDRALRILAVLQGDHRMSLGEIAQRLDLPPSTVHGIVRTLLAHRMVVQEHDSGQYRLGPAVLTPGQRLPRHPRAAVPGHPVGRGPRPAHRARRPHRRDAGRRRRRRAPRAAPGRVPADARGRHRDPGPRLRAGQGDPGVRRRGWPRSCSTGGPLRSMTGETVTDPAQLRAQLDEVRADRHRRRRSRRRCSASAGSRPC